jgi:hypothetical protein
VEISPLDGREDLGNADAAISVDIDKTQGFLIELEAFDGAAEGNPEFWVKVFEIEEIGSGPEEDLIEAAAAEEFPTMSRGHK